MICVDPEKRYTIPHILSHPWLKEMTEEESETENSQSSFSKPTPSEAEEFDKLSGNIDAINVDNLFYTGDYKCKLKYVDYLCITNEQEKESYSEQALTKCENFGYNRNFIVTCLNLHEVNHATATYYLCN